MLREFGASKILVVGIIRLHLVSKFGTVLLPPYPLRQTHSGHKKTLTIVITELRISDSRYELQRISPLAVDLSQSDQFDSCVTPVEPRIGQSKPVFFQDIYGDPVDSYCSPRGKTCSSIVTDQRPPVTHHEKLKNVVCRCSVKEIKVPTTVERGDTKAPVGLECLKGTPSLKTSGGLHILVQDFCNTNPAFGSRGFLGQGGDPAAEY